jgi:ribosome-associated protein
MLSGGNVAAVLGFRGHWLQKERCLSPGTQRSPDAPKTPAKTAKGLGPEASAKLILTSLDEDKAEDIVAIDIAGKSSVADKIIVASGRSQRHVGALADHIIEKIKEAGGSVRAEGQTGGDWVLIDAGDVIVHIFRPEVRAFYNIEKIWAPAPASTTAA